MNDEWAGCARFWHSIRRRDAISAGHRPCWRTPRRSPCQDPDTAHRHPRPSATPSSRGAWRACSPRRRSRPPCVRENRSAAAPVNAVSHWYWGDPALRKRRADARHTLSGYLIHHGASVFWAGLYAWVARDRPVLREPTGAVLGSLPTTALACFVDFRLTPARLTPGFEHRLSRPALAGVYAAFALGLAAGTILVGAEPDRGRERGPGDRRARPRRP